MALILDEVRQTRDALRYGFAVGKVRVLETRSLDRSAVERLLDARDFAEQKRLLSETPYAPFLEDANTAEEVERALDDALDGFYRFLDAAELPHAVVGFFRSRYDFANLKGVLKARALGVTADGLTMTHGSVPLNAFAADLDDLPDPLAAVARSLEGVDDTAVIDVEVDTAYFTELGRLARTARSGYLQGIAALMADVANVKSLVRGRLAGLPASQIGLRLIEGGTIPAERLAAIAESDVAEMGGSLVRLLALKGVTADELVDPARLDAAAESLVTAALRRGRREAAGPEPVIAYVMGREAEARTLRVLLLGTLTGIDGEALRARVDATYR